MRETFLLSSSMMLRLLIHGSYPPNRATSTNKSKNKTYNCVWFRSYTVAMLHCKLGGLREGEGRDRVKSEYDSLEPENEVGKHSKRKFLLS
jgi:hypothetical protein